MLYHSGDYDPTYTSGFYRLLLLFNFFTFIGALTQVDGANNETRNNGLIERVRQENRVDIDEIWRSPPPPSITSRGTDTERPIEREQSDSNINGTHRTNGRSSYGTNGTSTMQGSLTLPRGISHTHTCTHGPRNGLNTSTSFTLGTGNGLGLMLDGIDLSDLWNSNTLPGSRNLNSYFP